MTLLRVRDGSGVFASTISGKESMIADLRATDSIFVAWTGQFKTDIFQITHDELSAKVRAECARRYPTASKSRGETKHDE